ncbi:hypothetical protein Tco_0719336 [Tanacetum coccineum]
MESLHLRSTGGGQLECLQGIKLGASANISHIFYADDAVFGKDSGREKYISTLMHCCSLMSRVHAGMRLLKLVKKRLTKWNDENIIIRVPSGVLRTLESIRSHFFNGHKVLDPKERGGLDVNKAIHGDDGKTGVITRAGSKSCWMNIVHETNALLNKGIDLIKFMRIKLGNGQIISFWEDMWSEGGTLKNWYPRIYALESSKSITVGMKEVATQLAFSFRKRREVGGGVGLWRQEQFDEICCLVNDVILAPINRQMDLDVGDSGDFSVALRGQTSSHCSSRVAWTYKAVFALSLAVICY